MARRETNRDYRRLRKHLWGSAKTRKRVKAKKALQAKTKMKGGDKPVIKTTDLTIPPKGNKDKNKEEDKNKSGEKSEKSQYENSDEEQIFRVQNNNTNTFGGTPQRSKRNKNSITLKNRK